MTTVTHPLVVEARSWDWVHETTANHGLWVNALQTAAGGHDGDSWCMEFAWDCACRVTKGKPPFDREQSVQHFRVLAKARGWEVSYADSLPGDFVVSVDANDHGHHIGIETQQSPLITIAGNTDATGTSSNGTGVFEHPVNPEGKEFYRIPLVLS